MHALLGLLTILALQAVIVGRRATPLVALVVVPIAYRPEDYALLEKHVTAERVKDHFRGIALGEVVRYALPRLGALNFVLHRALSGGVTRSLALDPHGKSLSSALLSLEPPADAAV
jgi:hypothetical protein